MSRVFLSHSSRDNRQAIALKHWLVEKDPGLADEIFLDLDRHTGIPVGVRWKDALTRANARCEAVICLLSRHWDDSRECQAEYRTSENLNKPIFCARLEPRVGREITAEWQRCDLFGEGPTTAITIAGEPEPVVFLTEGLERLYDGLVRAGVGAGGFPWPPPGDPGRAPYRGWEPLDEVDAAVYFGRDAQLVRSLGALRGMRTSGADTLFVILGPSGAGKSSFLRAGLLPRLARDDRHFLPLDVVRPGRRPLTGDGGLADAVHALRTRLGLTRPTLGEIKAACLDEGERLAQWLHEAQDAALGRLVDVPVGMPPPTLVLPVDQAEEFFGAESGPEAAQLLALLARLLDTGTGTGAALPMLVVFAIRSDCYEPLQTAPELAALGSVVFDDLKPMPPTQFKEVVVGPADRATEAGRPLTVEPELVDRLLDESTHGADTLPLLALTLSRLYRDYGGDGDLTVAEYEAMGGMRQVVQTEIDALLARDPDERARQLERLKAAFIPWLATVNPDNDQPLRRVARWSDLPSDSRALIDAFVARRLLVKGERNGEVVVEVALESLLRQWADLVRWLRAEGADLKGADDLERTAAAWEKNDRSESWLLGGERLADAETLAAKPGFRDRLSPTREYLLASRRREDARLADEKRRRDAELQAARDRQQAAEALAAAESEAKEKAQAHATALRKRTRTLRAVVAVTTVVAVVAAVGWVRAKIAEGEADTRAREQAAMVMMASATIEFDGLNPGANDATAIQRVLTAHAVDPGDNTKYGLMHAALAERDLVRIIDAPNWVMGVAVSPDGRRIASAGWDDSVQLWDARTGQPIGDPMTGHENTVASVAFSPDGRRIVSGSWDKTIRIWDADTQQPVGDPLRGHENLVLSVAFSPDGRRIVSGSGDKTLRIWDADSRTQIGDPLTGHGDQVNSIALSPDGRRIVSGSTDGTVRIWDADTHRQVGGPLEGHTSWVVGVAFSPDGRTVVSGSTDKTMRRWNAETGAPIGEPLTGHTQALEAVAFSRDGSRIASGSDDKTVRLWDANTGQPIGDPYTGHEWFLSSVSFTPDGDVVSGSWDRTIRVWSTKSVRSLPSPAGEDSWVLAVAVSPDGRRIATGGLDGAVRIWDRESGLPIGVTPAVPEGVTGVAFGADGRLLVSAGADSTIRRWDPVTATPIGPPLIGHRDVVNMVAVSRDGRRIASASDDGTVRLWDADSGQELRRFDHEQNVRSVAFSPDGRRLVTGSTDGKVRVWDADSGNLVGTPFEGHTGWVTSVAFSPDGSRILSGSTDRMVRRWDAATGEPIGEPMWGHDGYVNSVAYSPDGTRIVSGGADNNLRIWDAESGETVGPPLTGHHGAVTSVAFAPDGGSIVSGSADSTTRVWAVPEATAEALCAKITENISREVWRDWAPDGAGYEEICDGLPVPPDTSGDASAGGDR
ncbi:TIR domain-containing protein [Rhodococcus sp. NPDC003318]|uniref:nSTAND1 domain-containing NTPase n=1 Tax=Rhodococcus sp. NPDC003318 TaxID=3364503 RepID=UPI0036BFBE88